MERECRLWSHASILLLFTIWLNGISGFISLFKHEKRLLTFDQITIEQMRNRIALKERKAFQCHLKKVRWVRLSGCLFHTFFDEIRGCLGALHTNDKIKAGKIKSHNVRIKSWHEKLPFRKGMIETTEQQKGIYPNKRRGSCASFVRCSSVSRSGHMSASHR